MKIHHYSFSIHGWIMSLPIRTSQPCIKRGPGWYDTDKHQEIIWLDTNYMQSMYITNCCYTFVLVIKPALVDLNGCELITDLFYANEATLRVINKMDSLTLNHSNETCGVHRYCDICQCTRIIIAIDINTFNSTNMLIRNAGAMTTVTEITIPIKFPI